MDDDAVVGQHGNGAGDIFQRERRACWIYILFGHDDASFLSGSLITAGFEEVLPRRALLSHLRPAAGPRRSEWTLEGSRRNSPGQGLKTNRARSCRSSSNGGMHLTPSPIQALGIFIL